MIKEAYVSFETAKLLEEKGFDEYCYSCYCLLENGDIVHTEYAPPERHNGDKKFISRPTQQMALAWLREGKNIFIEIGLNHSDNTYYYSTEDMNTHRVIYTNSENTYNETVEAALKYTLENLI